MKSRVKLPTAREIYERNEYDIFDDIIDTDNDKMFNIERLILGRLAALRKAGAIESSEENLLTEELVKLRNEAIATGFEYGFNYEVKPSDYETDW